MSKITNGTNRDIESILSDIRVQAQRRMRLAEVQGIQLDGLPDGSGQGSVPRRVQSVEAAPQPAPNPSAPERTSDQDVDIQPTGLSLAYQQRGAAEDAEDKDLPVILLKANATKSPLQPERVARKGEPAKSAPAPKPAPESDDSQQPLSSAFENLKDGLARSSPARSTAPQYSPAQNSVEPQPSNDNPTAATTGDRLSKLHPRETTPAAPQTTTPVAPVAVPSPASTAEYAREVDNAPAEPAQPVKRKMASFADTNISRMSGPHAPEAEVGSITKVQVATVSTSDPTNTATTESPTTAAATSALQQPMTSSSAKGTDSEDAGVHDMAAELLRPMLKDWVGANMPQIVEKALHIELSEMAKKDKKS